MWYFLISIVNFVHFSDCAIKSFKYDSDIYRPHHWVGGKPQDVCQGLIFPENVQTIVNLEELLVEEIVLPLDFGDIFLTEKTDILFETGSKTKMNCVELKDLKSYFWENPSVWETANNKNNEAIPHMERVPCEYDDVVLPHGINTPTILHDGDKVKLKSFRFGDEQWTNEDLIYYSKSQLINAILVASPSLEDLFVITNTKCEHSGGCLCGNELAYQSLCREVREVDSFSCLAPVTPIGFCDKICGASILAEPNYKFHIAKIEEILQNYNSDTYVSRVKNATGQELIQVIFTEKKFSGGSLDEANDLYQRILSDSSLRLDRAELYSSGSYYKEGEAARSTTGIVFGTLFVVLLVFAAIFLVHLPGGPIALFRSRYNFGSRPIPSFTSRFFARYNSVGEDAGLIFEGHSMAGSVASLEKAFENPLYGNEGGFTSSSASGSNSEKNGSLSHHEEKEADVARMSVIEERNEEVEKVAEEGKLVDLN